MLETWVLDSLPDEEALGPYYVKAVEHREREGSTDTLARLLDYLDLGDEIALLNRHASLLPADVAKVMRSLTPQLESLIGTRNRVMHGRPLLTEDPENVIKTATDLLVSQLPVSNLATALAHLANDPVWQPALPGRSTESDRIPNNLPVPDFDETGLIGRVKEARDLLDRLLSRRHEVITVVGEGGIGKTALAIKVLYDLIDHPDCPYDAILWCSLKTETLTSEGIEAIAGAVTDVTAATGALAGPLLQTTPRTFDDLSMALGDSSVLIVLDNTETLNTDDILRLYDALPSGVRYLFTSRVGMGQLERRVPLRPLDPDGAAKLFRLYARRRNLEHLASLPQEKVLGAVETLRFNPLATKWFINAIEVGGRPESLLHDQTRVLEFCIKSVFESLSDVARMVLTILYVLDRYVAFDELVVVTQVEIDDAQRALHELQQRSMVDVRADGVGLMQSFEMSSSIRQYFVQVAPPAPDQLQEIRSREEEVRKSEELRKKELATRQLAPRAVLIRGDGDVPVAHLLRQALDASRVDDISASRRLIEQAGRLSPEFFEVPRVAAFIEASAGNVERAIELYEQAMTLAGPEWRPVVAHYYAGHLTRGAHRPDLALPLSELAHDELRLPDTGAQLAQVLMYLGHFERADTLFAEAENSASGKLLLIARSGRINLAKRRAERLVEDKQAVFAVRCVAEAVARATKSAEQTPVDRRFNESLMECVSEGLRAAGSLSDLDGVEDDVRYLLGMVASSARSWRGLDGFSYAVGHARILVHRPDLPSACIGAGAELESALEHMPPIREGMRQRGLVVDYDQHADTGWIEPTAGGDLLPFGHQDLQIPGQLAAIHAGSAISFSVARLYRDGEIQRVATDVVVLGALPSAKVSDQERQSEPSEGADQRAVASGVDAEASQWQTARELREKSTTLHVEVLAEDEKGYLVSVVGLTGYLPKNQLSREKSLRVDGIGSRVPVVITKVNRRAREITVSQRPVEAGLVASRWGKIGTLWKIGDIVDGRVSSVAQFGVFIEFDGFNGLCHNSQLSWSRSQARRDLYRPGDPVRAQIIAIDPDAQKIWLSIKSTLVDPLSELKEGMGVRGTVGRVRDIDAYVTTKSGVAGVLHRSRVGGGVHDLRSLLRPGMEVDLTVTSVDVAERRVRFGMKRSPGRRPPV